MKFKILGILFLSAVFFIGSFKIGFVGKAQVVGFPPGPRTPTNLEVVVKKFEVGSDPIVPTFNVLDGFYPMDVVASNGIPELSEFGRGEFRKGDYRVIKIFMEGTGSYRGFNPCDGSEVLSRNNIYLPDGLPEHILNPDSEEPAEEPTETEAVKIIEINYNAPSPGTDLLPDAIQIPRYSITNTMTEVRLVFFTTDSVICASSASPLRLIRGIKTNMNNPTGITVDLNNGRIMVANSASNSVTFYDIDANSQTSLDGIEPAQTFQGSETLLNLPVGIYYDSTHDEIFVTNTGSNQNIVVFSNDRGGGNIPPKRRIEGLNTLLDEPESIYVDLTHDEIIVGNVGSDSINFYLRDASEDAKPKIQLKGFGTGLGEPSGLFLDESTDRLFVTNKSRDTIGIFDRQEIESSALPPPVVENGVVVTTGFSEVSPIILLTGPRTRLNEPVGIVVEDSVHFTGTAVGGTSMSLIADPLSFGTIEATPDGPVVHIDNYFYNRVVITGGTGMGESRIITSNSADELFVSPPWTVGPDVDSTFEIHGDNIFVSNSGDDRILVYSLVEVNQAADPVTGISEIPPIFTIRGKDTSVRMPQGLFVEPSTREIFVANNQSPLDEFPESITVNEIFHKTVQLEKLPRVVNSGTQQKFFPRYYYSGSINNAGVGIDDPLNPDSIVFEGYDIHWQITDDRLRQEKDVSEARLNPPSDIVFQLADGSLAGALDFGCPQFIPFIQLNVFTNCDPLPLIKSPYPLPTDVYDIPGVVLGSTLINKINFDATPRQPEDFPVPIPVLTLEALPDDGRRIIRSLSWFYRGEETPGVSPFPPLMLFEQNVSIFLKDDPEEIYSCYTLIGGTDNIVFGEQGLESRIRLIEEIKNNNCEIFFEDISKIEFTVKDSLENSYIYDWVPSL